MNITFLTVLLLLLLGIFFVILISCFIDDWISVDFISIPIKRFRRMKIYVGGCDYYIVIILRTKVEQPLMYLFELCKSERELMNIYRSYEQSLLSIVKKLRISARFISDQPKEFKTNHYTKYDDISLSTQLWVSDTECLFLDKLALIESIIKDLQAEINAVQKEKYITKNKYNQEQLKSIFSDQQNECT